jgi:hypothetical protein
MPGSNASPDDATVVSVPGTSAVSLGLEAPVDAEVGSSLPHDDNARTKAKASPLDAPDRRADELVRFDMVVLQVRDGCCVL